VFAYQLQDRDFYLDKDARLRFPNPFSCTVRMEPGHLFGQPRGEGDMGRTWFKDEGNLNVLFTPSTGKTLLKIPQLRQAIETTVQLDALTITVRGGEIRLDGSVQTGEHLRRLIDTFVLLLPIHLNLLTFDVPFVSGVRGKVGDVEFEWGVRKNSSSLCLTSREEFTTGVQAAINRVFMKLSPRILGALHYFHVACRLSQGGDTPWTFSGEILLNLAKSLEVLFGDRDSIRERLKFLDYNEDEIEYCFIPVLILRNEFDVGHPTTTFPLSPFKDDLYDFLPRAEEWMRELLRLVIHKFMSGELKIDDEVDAKRDKKRISKLNQVHDSIRKGMTLKIEPRFSDGLGGSRIDLTATGKSSHTKRKS